MNVKILIISKTDQNCGYFLKLTLNSEYFYISQETFTPLTDFCLHPKYYPKNIKSNMSLLKSTNFNVEETGKKLEHSVGKKNFTVGV